MTPEEIERLPYRKNVGVMLVNANGHVFVGQRMDSDIPAWQMPQGGIDKDEKPKKAALRELEEETGVSKDLVTVVAKTKGWISYDLPHDVIPKIWKGRFRGQKQKWFLMRFEGSDDQINIVQKHQEFSDWRWLPVEDLVANIVPFKRTVYQDVIDAFQDYL